MKKINFKDVAKSSIPLVLICLVISFLLAFVNLSTKSTIEKEKNLDINLQDKTKGWTPLYYLLDSSDGSETDILQMLIKSGTKINISERFFILYLY